MENRFNVGSRRKTKFSLFVFLKLNAPAQHIAIRVPYTFSVALHPFTFYQLYQILNTSQSFALLLNNLAANVEVET